MDGINTTSHLGGFSTLASKLWLVQGRTATMSSSRVELVELYVMKRKISNYFKQQICRFSGHQSEMLARYGSYKQYCSVRSTVLDHVVDPNCTPQTMATRKQTVESLAGHGNTTTGANP